MEPDKLYKVLEIELARAFEDFKNVQEKLLEVQQRDEETTDDDRA